MTILFRNRIVMLTLLVCFVSYTGLIYTKGTGGGVPMNPLAGQGKLLWQKHNCTACHQFYGLGGYLGPDLTNVASAPGKGPAYVRAMITSGKGQMPQFKPAAQELDALVAYLEYVDKTGVYPDRKAKHTWYGDVVLSEKQP